MTVEKRSDGQTISRAVAIMKAIAERPGASFGQIAKMTDLPRSTVQRLIGVLNKEGLVSKAFGQQGTYLGMELARLGAQVRLDARTMLRPFMEKLHEQIGDTIDLTTLENGKVIVIDQISSNEAIRVISYVGLHHPVHCTANGKAHLSLLDRDAALDLIGDSPEAFTAKTVIDPNELFTQMDAAKADGVFCDMQEYDEGACAIAVPLPEIAGRHFALSIAMPTQRMDRQKQTVKDALLKIRAEIVSEYGSSI